MNAAREFGDIAESPPLFSRRGVGAWGPAVLYDLSGNASLKGVRDEFVAETKAGTRIQGADIKPPHPGGKGHENEGARVLGEPPTLSTVDPPELKQ